MKTFASLLAALVMTTSALGAEVGEKQHGKHLGEEWRAKHAWRGLMYYLPGGYTHLDRIDLTDDQKKVLGEIATEYQKKRAGKMKDLHKMLPKLTGEDWGDAEKRKAYYEKRNELMKKAKLDPPMDAIRGVLTVEQADKLEDASKIETEWAKWVAVELPKYEARLTEAVGPKPNAPDYGSSYMMGRLEKIYY